MVPLDEIGFLASGLSLILVHELGHRQSGDDVAAFFALEWLRLSHDTTEYQRMLDAAGKRRFDVLLVWRYDRFARSMQELVNALEEFRTLGIDFVSYRENADTTTAQGKLIFGIMANLVEFERALIGERVKAGMARAKAQGKHVGRPRIPVQKEAAIRCDLLAGRGLRSTISAHGVGSKTVQRIKTELADKTTAL
jgi:DNA invertase Pin-like site-specific DNA recombinase